MTAQQILEAIKNSGVGIDEFAYGDFTSPEGVGEWEEVERVGQGDHWHFVKYFKNHNVYIKTVGYYSSYSGVDFYSGYGEEVSPKEETIIIYK